MWNETSDSGASPFVHCAAVDVYQKSVLVYVCERSRLYVSVWVWTCLCLYLFIYMCVYAEHRTEEYQKATLLYVRSNTHRAGIQIHRIGLVFVEISTQTVLSFIEIANIAAGYQVWLELNIIVIVVVVVVDAVVVIRCIFVFFVVFLRRVCNFFLFRGLIKQPQTTTKQFSVHITFKVTFYSCTVIHFMRWSLVVVIIVVVAHWLFLLYMYYCCWCCCKFVCCTWWYIKI